MAIRLGFLYETSLDDLSKNIIKTMLKYGHYFEK
jgi:hypothetical protein